MWTNNIAWHHCMRPTLLSTKYTGTYGIYTWKTSSTRTRLSSSAMTSHIPVIFGIPKVHKNILDPQLRPIISATGSVTYPLTVYVDRKLKPFLGYSTQILRFLALTRKYNRLMAGWLNIYHRECERFIFFHSPQRWFITLKKKSVSSPLSPKL